MKARLPIVLCLSSLVMLSLTSSAGAKTIADPNDTAGPLDIRHATLVRPTSKTMGFTVEMWDAWTKKDVDGKDAIDVNLDTRSTRKVDYVVVMASVSGSLKCFLVAKGSGAVLATKKATKPTAKTGHCTLPTTRMKISKTIRWQVLSVSGSRVDSAPNSGFVIGV